jgi:ribosome modulation factor
MEKGYMDDAASASPVRQDIRGETDFLMGYRDYYASFDSTTCPFHDLGRAQNWRAGWFSAEDEDNRR